MAGWIKLHRQFLLNGHFHMPDRALKVWLYILLSVSHREQPSRDVRAGEEWLSYSDIAKGCGESPERPMRREAVGSALRYLEEHGYIEREIRAGVGQKIIVVNWHKYQGTGSDAEPVGASTGSFTEPHQFRKRTGPVPKTDHTGSDTELVSKAPVRPADRTGSVNGPHRFAQRTGPVPLADQSIYKELQEEEYGEEEKVSSSLSPSLSEDEIQQALQQVARHHESAIGMFGKTTFDEFQFWIVEQSVDADVVCAAIDRAVDAGVRRWSYAAGILRNWHNDGIRTVADLNARERADPRRRGGYDEEAALAYLDEVLGGLSDDASASA